MSYEPDHHLNVIFDFDGEYSLPDAWNVIIDFDDDEGGQTLPQYLNPLSLDALSIGQSSVKTAAWTISIPGFNNLQISQPTIDFLVRSIKNSGSDFQLFGQSSIRNTAQAIKVGGYSAGLFGKPELKITRVFLNIPGINSLLSGQARISYKLQSAQTIQIRPFSEYGNPTVSHGVRYLEQTNAPLFTQYGAAWASHSPRYIEPRGVFELFPSRHTIGTSRSIQMFGFDALRFGARIIPENQTVYPQGFSNTFGQAEIYNHVQHIRPRGFLTYGTESGHRFGYGEVWNSTQIIHPNNVEHGFGPFFADAGQWQIFNRNRYVQTHGQQQTRFGYQELNNTARVIAPQGINSPVEVEATRTMVADGIRHFSIPSIEAPYISTRHVVHLGARAVAGLGRLFSEYGQPNLKNTRRYFNYIGLGEQSLFGKPMISDAVRHIRLQSDYSIHPPVIPMPSLIHGQREFEMRGIDSVRYGTPYIVSKWNTAMPRWTHIDRVGEPVIKNVTPEIRMWGLLDDDYGRPYIGHYTRTVNAQGLNSQIFGRLKIADRKQVVNLSGFGLKSEQINRLHKIEKFQTETYSDRYIYPSGIATPNFAIGAVHQIHHNSIRPDSEKPMTLFGNARITANTIRVEPGYWEILMGKPLVEYANRTVSPKSIGDMMEFGKPRLSPHTIYAVVEAPQQAIDNHERSMTRLHYVDGLEGDRIKEPGVEFGRPSVTHKQRFIQVQGEVISQFGISNILNAQFFIQPRGLNSLRIGVLGPIGDQEIRFRLQNVHSQYGNALVQHYFEKNSQILVAGQNFLKFGQTEIQHFHRSIYPQGVFSQAMGTRKTGDQPYMWQGFRVGEHVPTRFGGEEHSIFGTTWISHRVRELIVGGEDFQLVGEYDPANFKQRLYVWNRNQPELPAPRLIQPHGLFSQMAGVPNIKPAAHYIRPDGNTDNYRKGAPDA